MMELLLPILLSAAAVWIVSAIVWIALPHHQGDFPGLPDEDGFMDYIRKSGIQSPARRRLNARRSSRAAT